MKNGDLSNRAGYTIAFRCVDFLVKYQEGGIKNNILNNLFGKTRRAVIDETVKSVMEHLYRDTDYNVDIVVENKDYTPDLKAVLENIPFGRVVLIDKPSQLVSRLLVGDITYYVDGDSERRKAVGSYNAIGLEHLYTILSK